MGTQLCYISGSRVKSKNGKPEFLIIVSFNKPDQALINYKERWQIENCFRSMKSSGFDMEKTHLRKHKRIEKLLLLIIIAYIWCYKTKIYYHEYVKNISIKKHGRKAKSIFKHGLSKIATILSNPSNQGNINAFKLLSCT